MMPTAQQHQVPQICPAAVQPVAQVVGVAPGHRPVTPGNRQPPSRTASAARWAGAMTRVRDPPATAPVDAPPSTAGSRPIAVRSRAASPGAGSPSPSFPAGSPSPPPSPAAWWWPGWPSPGWSRWWRVTSTRVSAASQANRRAVSAGSGPTQAPSPASRPGWPSRLARSMVTATWGRTPPDCGSRPPSSWRRANSVNASARRWAAVRSSSAVLGRARGSRAVSRVSPASASSSPSTATMPSKVGATHSPRRSRRRRACSSAAWGSATSQRWPTTLRSRGGSSRRAAASSTGSAAATVPTGSSWVARVNAAACR
jgi:hypothetical protein